MGGFGWLFTSVAEKLNQGLPEGQIQLVVKTGFEYGISGSQCNHPSHWDTQPSIFFFRRKRYFGSLVEKADVIEVQ